MLYSEHWRRQLVVVLSHRGQRDQSWAFLGKKWEQKRLLISLILLAFTWCFCVTCLPPKSGKFAPNTPCLVSGFSTHRSHGFGKMPYLFAVSCACLVLQLSVTWVSHAQLHASLHLPWSDCSHTYAKPLFLCLAMYFFFLLVTRC